MLLVRILCIRILSIVINLAIRIGLLLLHKSWLMALVDIRRLRHELGTGRRHCHAVWRGRRSLTRTESVIVVSWWS